LGHLAQNWAQFHETELNCHNPSLTATIWETNCYNLRN
jgi:hypothetical protein